jgi:hypothetical protein
MKTVHVLYENAEWLPPLTEALASRGLDVVEHFVDGGTIDISSPPPEGVFINRMSPSSHTRGHQGGVIFMGEYLAWLESWGRRVINGSEAFALEVSKVRQHAILQSAAILTPRTIAVIGLEAMRQAARDLTPPFITKHNQGGKGLGVQLFSSHEALDATLDVGGYDSSPDSVNLLQQYILPAEPFITRVEIVDGRFLYAIRSSTEGGFELCPADACAIDDAFCPVGGQADSGKFALRRDITADDPLVRRLIKLCRAHRIDVAGIEFVEDVHGNRYVYDINGTTNYNSAVEAAHGLHGMGAIADLCLRELSVKGAAAAR